MIIAVDTNVLLDILLPDPVFASSSEESLRRCSDEGQLVISEIVYAELCGLFPSQKELDHFLLETGIEVIASHRKTLWKAGELWRVFCLRKSSAHKSEASRRILADFLIGAHALFHAEALLTRDKGFYHKAFSVLKII